MLVMSCPLRRTVMPVRGALLGTSMRTRASPPLTLSGREEMVEICQAGAAAATRAERARIEGRMGTGEVLYIVLTSDRGRAEPVA